MVNKELLERFLGMVAEGGTQIMEHGLQRKTVQELNIKYNVTTFDPGSSMFAMVPKGFRASGMMHLPFGKDAFDGAVLKNTMSVVGDRDFFIKEVFRIVKGPVLFVESALEYFPLETLAENEDLIVVVASADGRMTEINESWAQLISKMDFRKIFRLPGGKLNKFNQLTPEDVKIDIGVICTKG
jgi:ubiquinone/menaquinone biosynthesis C-methylase UbiE